MSVAWKLAISYALRRPVRMLLTSLAMIASACIVVWVVSGYDALVAQFGDQAAEYLGRYDFFVVPEDPQDATVDSSLVKALRADPAVAEATPVIQLSVRLVNPNRGPGGFGGGPPGGLGGRAGSQPGPVASEQADPPSGPRGGQGPSAPGGERRGGTGRPGGMRFGAPPMLVGTDAEKSPHELVEGTWIDVEHPEKSGAVLSKGLADRMGLEVGDEALVFLGMEEVPVNVVGIVADGPAQMGMGRRMRPPGSQIPLTGIEAGPASSAVYVPSLLAEYISGGKAKVNLINIQLTPEAKSDVAAFRKTWEGRIGQSRPSASLLGMDDVKTGMEEGMMASRTRQEAWAATGLSLLAALFIIFTTLSMGVTERVRQFAILRAVGLSRRQVAAVIAVEAVLLALIGWGGGLLAGWGLLTVLSRMQTGLFRSGASLGTWCIALTGLSALGGALAASVLPAWRAMSVQPLEALSPQRAVRSSRSWSVGLGIAGLALIAINPILVYVASASIASDKLYGIYTAVGCTTMAIGFLLLTPATILIVENVIGPVLARGLGLDPRLLRSQLGSNLWRSLGTTAALTVGLGLFVAMQIWGYSMLEPFKPGECVPDLLVAFQRGGLPESEIEAVRALPGVRGDQFTPLAVEQPRLAGDITGSENQSSVIRQNNVIMVGLDPQVAFGGPDRLFKVRFVEGSPETAIAELKRGHNCIVPDHFLKATGLGLGDSFAVVPPHAPSKRIEYTIVGAVSLPGWHWMTKFSGLRRREGRSAAIVFADYETVRKDYDLKQVNFFWMNVDSKYGAENMAKAKELAEQRTAAAVASRGQAPGMPAPPSTLVVNEIFDDKKATVELIGTALQPIADRNLGEAQPVNGQGTWPMGATMFGPSVRVSTPAQVGAMILARASGMIWASCYLPLITLVVTSLGVINTVMASVRARRWEFGVLRSQGLGRSGLIRMILAEGFLIGLITCLLSLGFGVFSGWCGTGISQYVSFFGGLAPPLVIPWAQLSIGFGIAMGLCLIAALWPAIATGRAEPLRLLQEGRAAM